MQLALAAATAIALAGGLYATFPRVASAAHPPSATGPGYAVSTDQADATRAALEVLAGGGNAVDGAIAAALALGVVNPSASGIGGGGFALVYTAKDHKVTALDFRETAPATYSADVLWRPVADAHPRGDAGSPSASRWAFKGVNGGVVGVPGEPAGLELLSRRFGRKSLAVAAAPAATLARNGFYVSAHLAEVVAHTQERVVAAPALASVFLPGAQPVRQAAWVRLPDLAGTITRFGAEGKRSIYEGATAQKIVDVVTSAGGTLGLADLAGYQVAERKPLERTIGGRTIATMPAPSAGGLMLQEVLGMYGATSSSELAKLGFGSSAYIHMVAEAMRGALADRARIAADPDLVDTVDAAYRAALDDTQLAARRAMIRPTKTLAPSEFKTREKGTSHLLVTDAEGNIVALTTTVNGPFGASLVAEGTGILLNNELDDFSHPDDGKPYGFKDGGPNRPRPKARPVSSMTPTIIFENGAPILAVGGSGGTRIATGVTQATLARLVFGLDPNACVSAPRFHTQGVELLVDRDTPLDVREGLAKRGEAVKDETFGGSAIQMIAWRREPGQDVRILAAADPRKAGLAAAR